MSDTPFKIDIDAEAVNKAISDAVLKSSIGVELKAAVKKHIDGFENEYKFRQAIDKMVEKQISHEIQTAMEQHRDLIQEFVSKKLSTEMLDKIMEQMWNKWDRGW